jgi:hypothetical protein
MSAVERYKNFIIGDPILDCFESGSTEKPKISGLLSEYIASNKSKFKQSIKQLFRHGIFDLETERGMVDIIVKTKYLDKTFVNDECIPGEGYSLFTVEYSSLNLDSDRNICKTKRQEYYLFKNWLLTKEIEKNIKIDGSYILGRKYTFDKETHNNVFLLARNIHSFDTLLMEADIHLEKVLKKEYSIGRDIFPNMKNTMDAPWRNVKKKISKSSKEITSVWRCSPGYRNKMHDMGLMTYDEMIYPSRLIGGIVKNKKKLRIPEGVKMVQMGNPLFIDFEILTSVYDDFLDFPKSNDKSYIFNIGCGYIERGNFKFKSWVAHTLKEEEQIVREFISFIEAYNVPVLYHWTNIEKRYLLEMVEKYDIILNRPLVFFDLYKFFVDSEIVMKGCSTFKLKDVAGALYKSGLIKSKWNTSSKYSDGVSAMVGYIEYLESKDSKIINSIAEYNRIDCKVLWEIWKLF